MNRSTGRRAAPREASRRPLLLAAAVAVVLFVGVGGYTVIGGNDDPGTAGSASSVEASSTGSTAAEPGSGDRVTPGTDDPSAPQSEIRTATDLEGIALRGSDLPPGWRSLDAAGAATRELIGACLRKATTPAVPHVVLTQSFRSGSNGPVLTTAVRDFSTQARADSAMRAVRAAVAGCVRGPGSPDLTARSVATDADETVAVGFTITRQGSSAQGEVIVARVGSRSTTQVLIGLSEADLEIGRDAVRVAVERLG